MNCPFVIVEWKYTLKWEIDLFQIKGFHNWLKSRELWENCNCIFMNACSGAKSFGICVSLFNKVSWNQNKLSFSKLPILKIDWCKGQWCGSTYMVVRMSDVSSKIDKNAFFVVLGCFWAYVRQLHHLIGWATSMLFA